MKILKKKSGIATLAKHILDPKEIARSRKERQQQLSNEDTAARVKAVLAQLSGKDYVVLAKAESDSGGKDYEIRVGSNNAIYCTCKGWQYDKTGKGCKHLLRWKQQVQPITVLSDKR